VSRTARKAPLLVALLAAAALGAAPAALACGSSGYTYAGLASSSKTHGVGARLTAIGAPSVSVTDGHVAGWVGVGGPGEGPNGEDEWIQVGLSGFAGSPDSSLYYEVTQAGSAPKYVEVERNLAPGATRRVAVLEVAGQPNAWRVWVDGRAVSDPIYLPGSDGAWRGVATAESWTSDGSAACNRFGYRFDDVRIAQQAGGAWQTLADALPIRTGANRLVLATPASFEAVSADSPAPATPGAKPVYVAGAMQRTLASSRAKAAARAAR
jgi:hypothetical protein